MCAPSSLRFSVSSFLAFRPRRRFPSNKLSEKKVTSSPVLSVLLHLRSSVSTDQNPSNYDAAGKGSSRPSGTRSSEPGDARKEENGAVQGRRWSLESLPRIGGSTIQDYSLSLRGGCARARRPSMRSRNIRRGGVGCHGLLSFSLSFPTLLYRSPRCECQPFLRFTIPRLYPTSFARSIFFPLFSPPLTPSPRYLLTPVPHDGSESFWGFRYIHAGKSIKEGSMYLKRSSDRTVSDCFEAGCMDGYKMTRSFSYALRNWRYVARFRERTLCIGMSY